MTETGFGFLKTAWLMQLGDLLRSPHLTCLFRRSEQHCTMYCTKKIACPMQCVKAYLPGAHVHVCDAVCCCTLPCAAAGPDA
jgi:hypothetical protein